METTKRKNKYLDVFLNEKQVKRLKGGYAVNKKVKGIRLSIKCSTVNRSLQIKIKNLTNRIQELKKKQKELKGGKHEHIKTSN